MCLRFLFLLLTGLLLSSCQSLFLQKTINVPQLEKKNDISVGGSYGFNGFNVQGAMAVSDRIGIMGNTFFTYNNDPKYKNDYHRYAEAGVGYFKCFGNNAEFEAYGGAGFGQINAEYSRTFDNFLSTYILSFLVSTVITNSYFYLYAANSSGYSYTDNVRAIGHYNTQFGQVNLSFPTSDDLYLCLTLKLCRAGFNDYKEEIADHPGDYVLLSVPSQVFYQPAITLISRGKRVRVFTQLGYTGGINQTTSLFSWQTAFASMGFTVRLNAGK